MNSSTSSYRPRPYCSDSYKRQAQRWAMSILTFFYSTFTNVFFISIKFFYVFYLLGTFLYLWFNRLINQGRLHHCSSNLGSTEHVQLLERILFRVQRIWAALRIYERVLLNLSLTRDLCRSPHFTNSYWLKVNMLIFAALRSALARHLLWRRGWLSVCLSLCLSRWCIVPKRPSWSSCDPYHIVARPF